ncbi:MAG: hypothetical protein ACK5KN_11150, partial [Dysgonomonas sp.]|uniref:hypothetical protein n=1 Tax=Dysgonomonas sp. TaxID=1891233 RepID=UPI003A8AA156
GVNDVTVNASQFDPANWDFNSVATTNFIGAFNFVLSELYKVKPEAKVILLTHFSDDRAESPNNKNFYENLNKTIVALSGFHKLPCIRMNELSGWVNRDGVNTISPNCPDGIHPASDSTYKSVNYLADIIRSQISVMSDTEKADKINVEGQKVSYFSNQASGIPEDITESTKVKLLSGYYVDDTTGNNIAAPSGGTFTMMNRLLLEPNKEYTLENISVPSGNTKHRLFFYAGGSGSLTKYIDILPSSVLPFKFTTDSTNLYLSFNVKAIYPAGSQNYDFTNTYRVLRSSSVKTALTDKDGNILLDFDTLSTKSGFFDLSRVEQANQDIDFTGIIQQALDTYKTVYIPDRGFPYTITDRLLLNSGNRLILDQSAEIFLANGSNVCMLRNRNMLAATHDSDIIVEGGIWNGNRANNTGSMYSVSDKVNPLKGVSGLINFMGVDNFNIRNVTIKSARGFSLHIASCNRFEADHITFVDSGRDGIHVGGYTNDFVIRNIYGTTIDDFIALNAWDWEYSTPEPGNIKRGLVENLYPDPDQPITWGLIRLFPGGEYTLDDITIRNIHGVNKQYCINIQDQKDTEGTNTTTAGHIGNIVFDGVYCYSNNTASNYPINSIFRIGTVIDKLTIKNWFIKDNTVDVMVLINAKSENDNATVCGIRDLVIGNVQTINGMDTKNLVLCDGFIDNLRLSKANITGQYSKAVDSADSLIYIRSGANAKSIIVSDSTFAKLTSLIRTLSATQLSILINNVIFTDTNKVLDNNGNAKVFLTNAIIDLMNIVKQTTGSVVLKGKNIDVVSLTAPVNKTAGDVRYECLDVPISETVVTAISNQLLNNGTNLLVRNTANTGWIVLN